MTSIPMDFSNVILAILHSQLVMLFIY